MSEAKCKHGITAWREFCVICGDGQPPVEHSERARYVTDLVAEWIVNDGDYYSEAREVAGGGTDKYGSLSEHLSGILRTGRRGTAPWYVGRELAANDYDRIHWDDVADVLLAE